MIKKLLSFLLILCISSSLFACKNKDKESTEPVFEGEISISAYKDNTINPLVTKLHTNAMAYSIIYSPLVKINADLSTENILLDSFTKSKDGLTYTFTLGNHKFSDGSPVTADNVITSLKLLEENPDSCFYQVFDYISSYKKLTDNKFSINLNKANSNFVSLLNFPIVKDKNSNIGSGPFMVKEITDEAVFLTANKNAVSIPSLKDVTVRIFPNTEVSRDAFSNSETDIINVDINTLAQFSSKTGINEYNYISDDFTFFGFNCENEFFKDINVKKALAVLIDKDKLCQSILVGHAVKTATPFKSQSIYSHNSDYERNVEKAAEYLALSEYDFSDISFSLLINQDNLSVKNAAEFIAGTLKENSINVSCVYLDADSYRNKIAEGNFDAFIGEITMPSNGDISFLLKEGNMFNFKSGAVNNALYAFNSATTEDGRKKLSTELNKVYLNTLPFISLYYKSNILLVSDKYTATSNITPCGIFDEINLWKKIN